MRFLPPLPCIEAQMSVWWRRLEMMAELCNDHTYELNCGRRSDRISVLHVKLTDSALKTLQNYHSCENAPSSRATIRFQGRQGRIKIPKSKTSDGSHNFDFYLSNFGKDNPQGSYECIRQYLSSSGTPHLSSLGTIQDKITVCSTNDSFQMTKERVTQTDEDTRQNSAKFIKGPFRDKKVQPRKPAPSAPDPVPERKQTTPLNPANTIRKCLTNNPVSQRPYRDRVIHLLALRSYKKLEVLARLQRDGVSQKDRNSLGSTLHQVANLNPKDNSYSLKNFIYREVQKDWPGYTEDERVQIDRVLARKLGLNSESVSSSSPTKEPTSPQCQPETDFTDPLMSKKPRISHLSNRGPPAPSQRQHSETGDKKPTPPATAACPGPFFHPPPASGSNSNSPSTPEGRGSQDLPLDQSSVCGSSSENLGPRHHTSSSTDQPISTSSPSSFSTCTVSTTTTCSTNLSSTTSPAAERDGTKKHKSKKHKEKERNRDGGRERDKERKREREQRKEDDCDKKATQPRKKHRIETEPKHNLSHETHTVDKDKPVNSTELPVAAKPDYKMKYTAVISMDQRQHYKDDYNAEYDEYRVLHARVESITRRFAQLDAQCRRLAPGTKEYQGVHERVLQEYKNIKHHSPNYYEEKQRCEYLHNKLAHIKRLIADFDQRRAQSWL